MTRGRELPVNSKVRRRLFSEDEPPPTKQSTWNEQDYLSGISKTEYIDWSLKSEMILKGMKWNFDFENEEPMDGPFKWYRKGSSGEWVGMKAPKQTTNMRKRNRDSKSAVQSLYEDERIKLRRLPGHSVVQKGGFSNDGRSWENAINEVEDDEFTNAFMDDTSPTQCGGIHWNFGYVQRVPLDCPVDCHTLGEDGVGHRTGLQQVHCTDKVLLETSAPSHHAILTQTLTKQEKEDEIKGHDMENGNEIENGDEREKKYKIDEEDIMEKVDEVNYAFNNVTENIKVATDKSYMVDLTKEMLEIENDGSDNKALSVIPKDNFENLKIKKNANTNMEEQDLKDEANDMKEKNEVTPRNEKEERTVPVSPEKGAESRPRVLGDKAKRRLYNHNFY